MAAALLQSTHTDGMAIEDIAWGHRIYENALNMGLGISLNLWENPYLY